MEDYGAKKLPGCPLYLPKREKITFIIK